MKKLVAAVLGALVLTTPNFSFAKKAASSGGAGGSHSVNGHFKKNGTYVAPHRATNPNQTQRANYSSKPNVNPYNGKQGTKEPKY
jgi:hypothetical protein